MAMRASRIIQHILHRLRSMAILALSILASAISIFSLALLTRSLTKSSFSPVQLVKIPMISRSCRHQLICCSRQSISALLASISLTALASRGEVCNNLFLSYYFSSFCLVITWFSSSSRSISFFIARSSYFFMKLYSGVSFFFSLYNLSNSPFSMFRSFANLACSSLKSAIIFPYSLPIFLLYLVMHSRMRVAWLFVRSTISRLYLNQVSGRGGLVSSQGLSFSERPSVLQILRNLSIISEQNSCEMGSYI